MEPVGRAEEILPAPLQAELAQLPRLYTAASLCSQIGRFESAVEYAQAAVRLQADPRYDPFAAGWPLFFEGIANFNGGRTERALEIFTGLAARSGPARIYGRCVQIALLASLGRTEEASALAEETLAAAQAHANPYLVAMALRSCGLAYTKSDPTRALDIFNQGLAYLKDRRQPFWDACLARETARHEAVHGDPGRSLTLYDIAIDYFHQSGDVVNLASALGYLAATFHRFGLHDAATTLYGAGHRFSVPLLGTRPDLPDRLRAKLGQDTFERCAAIGSAMEPADAVRYAHHQIQLARQQLPTPPQPGGTP